MTRSGQSGTECRGHGRSGPWLITARRRCDAATAPGTYPCSLAVRGWALRAGEDRAHAFESEFEREWVRAGGALSRYGKMTSR